MRVTYVTMLFPAPSEVFAATDIRALRALQADVTVHSLRPAQRGVRARLAEHGLQSLPLTFASPATMVVGLAHGIRHPVLAAGLVAWVVQRTWLRPADLVKSLILLPRVLEIARSLRDDPPDVVHLFWGHYPTMVGWVVARQLPDVVLSVFLGAYDLTGRYGGSADVARMADVVWTHAAVNVPAIQRLGVQPARLRVAFRGIDPGAIPARTRPPLTSHRLLAIGRLIPSKAFDDVLEVFARVRPAWPDASLTILGDGPERRRLEQLARHLGVSDATSFLGHVSHERVLAELADADVLLFMSRKDSERLPNVVKEAMACECFCVATRTAGMDELIEDRRHGFLIDPGDIAGAAGFIDAVFRRREPALSMVADAKARVRDHFDARTTMEAYLRTWLRLRATRIGRSADVSVRDGRPQSDDT